MLVQLALGFRRAFVAFADGEDFAVGADPSTQILLKVTDVNEEPTTDALNNRDQQIATIANQAGDDILDQMVNLLQSQYGAEVNRTLAEQATVR